MFFDVPRQLPTAIHFEMSCGGLTVTPRRGTIFACVRRAKITTSLQKICGFVSDGEQGKRQRQNRTPVTFRNSSGSKTRIRLMQTFELPMAPWNTSPKPPAANGLGWISKRFDEIVYDVGSIIQLPHILLSSRRHLWEV